MTFSHFDMFIGLVGHGNLGSAELTTLLSSVTMPSYVVQFMKLDLFLYEGSNTQFLPKLAFSFSLSTIHLI